MAEQPIDVFQEERDRAEKLKREAAKANIDLKKHYEDLREMMREPVGRRVIWWMISMGRPFQSPYASNASIYRNCGRQEASWKLLEDCKVASLDLFHEMEKEAMKQEEKEKGEKDNV
jgi:hypothetical protein